MEVVVVSKLKENTFHKVIKENLSVVVTIVALIFWFARLEARINQVEKDQRLMNEMYREQLSEIKEISKNLSETTQELRVTVTELRTEIKFIKRHK